MSNTSSLNISGISGFSGFCIIVVSPESSLEDSFVIFTCPFPIFALFVIAFDDTFVVLTVLVDLSFDSWQL